MKKKSRAAQGRKHGAASGKRAHDSFGDVFFDAGDEFGGKAGIEDADDFFNGFPDSVDADDAAMPSATRADMDFAAFAAASGELSPEALLALFDAPQYGSTRRKPGKQSGRRVISQEEILDFFGYRKGRKRKVELLLAELTAEGRLIRLKGPAYALPERLAQVRGRISIQRQGMGFVRPELASHSIAAGSNAAEYNSGHGSEHGAEYNAGHSSRSSEHSQSRNSRSSDRNSGRNPGRKSGHNSDRNSSRNTEIYIHPSQLGGAWDGDRVLVALLPGQSGKNQEGRVIEVLERSLKEAAVVLLPEMVREDGEVKRLARPLDARLSGYLLVSLASLGGAAGASDSSGTAGMVGSTGAAGSARADETVLVTLLPESEQRGDGVIRANAVTVLGAQKSLHLHERLVKAAHGIHTSFPPEVLEECASLPAAPDPADVLEQDSATPSASHTPKSARRRDMRSVGFVTIDGEDARDFDDAIQVERVPEGYLLRVAIADVAHYVRPGSALDREALERGNSCYFPASVEPMLPEALSNGLCSLKPDEPRLAMVAEIIFDQHGEPGKSAFYPALIESKGRLTYTQVHAALELEDESARLELRAHLPMLALASELARLLMRKRSARGSLDFDLPEPQIALNDKGEVQNLLFSQRHFSNRLIEEFMIAANEAVARHLESLDASFLFRAHPAPDPEKLAVFFATLERNGLLGGPEFSEPGVSGAASFSPDASSLDVAGHSGAAGRSDSSADTHAASYQDGQRAARSREGTGRDSKGHGKSGKSGKYGKYGRSDWHERSERPGRSAKSGRQGQSFSHGRAGSSHSAKRSGSPAALRAAPTALDLQRILSRVSGTSEEYVVNRLLLRSMMQARYTPEADGHFGLASDAYCHFTSPIRRYADLVVHRVLRRSMGLGDHLPSYEQLTAIADSLNESERNAVDAEREIQKISAALFLSDSIGEEFEATVSGMSSFGLFVELKSMPAEGFLPVEELEGDFYRFDSERQMLVGLRGGRIYRLGQQLRVVLDKADPARQEVRFFLSPESHPEAIGRKGKPLKGPARGSGGYTERKPAGRGKSRKPREKFKSGAVRVRKKSG